MQKYVFSKLDLKVKRQYFRYEESGKMGVDREDGSRLPPSLEEYINWLLIDEILTYVFIYGGPSTSF